MIVGGKNDGPVYKAIQSVHGVVSVFVSEMPQLINSGDELLMPNGFAGRNRFLLWSQPSFCKQLWSQPFRKGKWE